MSLWVELLAGVLGGAVGGTATTFIRPARAPKHPKPICSCRHGAGMHGAEGCRWQSEEKVQRYDSQRGSTYFVDETRRCTCTTYDGPPSWLQPL